jgi:hypothetical protein
VTGQSHIQATGIRGYGCDVLARQEKMKSKYIDSEIIFTSILFHSFDGMRPS